MTRYLITVISLLLVFGCRVVDNDDGVTRPTETSSTEPDSALPGDSETDPLAVAGSDTGADKESDSGSDSDSDSDSNSDIIFEEVSLKLAKTLLCSVTNPVGIASDQHGFWIMSGQHNGSTHELAYLELETNEVTRSFSFENLIEVAGTGVYGVAWDGETVWASVSGNTNKLVQIDPQTGEILNTLASPTTLGPSDLDWEGTRLWIASGTGQIYAITPDTLEVESFYQASDGWRDSGIAVFENRVWTGDLFFPTLFVFDADTGEKLDVQDDEFVESGMMTFHQNQLVCLATNQLHFYDLVKQ